jgi:hypothetical protein
MGAVVLVDGVGGKAGVELDKAGPPLISVQNQCWVERDDVWARIGHKPPTDVF